MPRRKTFSSLVNRWESATSAALVEKSRRSTFPIRFDLKLLLLYRRRRRIRRISAEIWKRKRARRASVSARNAWKHCRLKAASTPFVFFPPVSTCFFFFNRVDIIGGIIENRPWRGGEFSVFERLPWRKTVLSKNQRFVRTARKNPKKKNRIFRLLRKRRELEIRRHSGGTHAASGNNRTPVY